MIREASNDKPDTNRYFFYARRSSVGQEESLEQQYADFEKYPTPPDAERMDYVGDTISATKRSYEERVYLMAILEVIQEGDHLVVWKMDRLGRTFIEVCQMIELLAKRGIWLHSIKEYGGGGMNFSRTMDRTQARVMAILHDAYIENMREACLRSWAYKRECGLAASGTPRRAHKRVRIQGPKGKVYAVDRWDLEQLADYAFIYHAHNDGMSWEKIALDLQRRGRYFRVRDEYHRWTKKRPGGVHKGRPKTKRVIFAYKEYQKWLDAKVLPGMENDTDALTYGWKDPSVQELPS